MRTNIFAVIAATFFAVTTMLTPAVAATDQCGENVLRVAAEYTDLTAAVETRVGEWPDGNLCQTMAVLSKTGTTAEVLYVWYGLNGHVGSQRPGADERVLYSATIDADGTIRFTSHWGAELAYRPDGTSTYTQGAVYAGYAAVQPVQITTLGD